ncbi:hypothetical protein [Thioalkalivibrio thiocyanoxidans]|uniref:hypothetical protein n=1 Tax=Thioalkalivibrio thiocyanoxidans TaxID=152475 RepID=UPI0003A48E27|nr:hypothetical protein [Thioalkalivibrio thiocyanoxidans]
MSAPESPRYEELTTGQKVAGCIVAAVVFLIAIVVWVNPPVQVVTEYSREGDILGVTERDFDATTPFTILTIGALIIVGYVLNGLRFSRISAAGVSAEAKDAGQAAEKYYLESEGAREEEEVSVEEKASPEASEDPVQYVQQEDGDYAVYPLEAVPVTVIGDALSNWPEDVSKPDDLSNFEFATRKTGKGNHPWTVKFKGRKAITVSYGGYGKSGATVAGQ